MRSMMQCQADHMVRLIDDLLDVSRITLRGRLELRKTEVDLADIVRDAIASTYPPSARRSLPSTRSSHARKDGAMLYADAHRLTQILTNLLNNAAKYTPREGHIQIAIETSAPKRLSPLQIPGSAYRPTSWTVFSTCLPRSMIATNTANRDLEFGLLACEGPPGRDARRKRGDTELRPESRYNSHRRLQPYPDRPPK